MLHQAERQAVILEWLQSNFMVNVIDSPFVDHFIKETGCKFDPMIVGAHRCKTLSRDLAAMHKANVLDRCSMGLGGAGAGFPKWIYCYSLPGKFKD